jgi:hypothetical protein
MTSSRTDPEPGSAPESLPATGARPPRRPYAPPVLEVLGDVRELTLGPSGGVGDSIDINTRQAV